jgi:D-alanyl-D-alanine carboxypeptidase
MNVIDRGAARALRPARGVSLAALAALGLLAGPAVAQTALQTIDPAALQATFDGLADELLQPGAVMLLRTPQCEVVLTHGARAIGDATPISVEDHFRIGSNTKTMTGTAILQMVEEGKIALDDPVSKYRPEVPNGDNITITQLLNMRSGLFNYSTTYEMNKILDDEPLKVWRPEEMLAIGYRIPPYFPPGEGYRYSNTNTVLLGLIAEQIDGKPLHVLLHDRIFGPLGLAETSLPAPEVNTLPEPFARGYMYTDNVITLADNSIPPDLQFDAQQGTLLPNDQTEANPSWGWSAGAGISTAGDLADYVEGMVDGKLLGPELQKTRLDSLLPVDPSDPTAAQYGLAIARFGPMLGHTGELPGYNSFMGRDPVNDVTLIVWSTVAPAADGRGPAIFIARTLLGQIYAAAP